jgi:hypothetical protein
LPEILTAQRFTSQRILEIFIALAAWGTMGHQDMDPGRNQIPFGLDTHGQARGTHFKIQTSFDLNPGSVATARI